VLEVTCNILTYGQCYAIQLQVKLAAAGSRVAIVVDSYVAPVGGIHLGCMKSSVVSYFYSCL
jgi:hypothetical protein